MFVKIGERYINLNHIVEARDSKAYLASEDVPCLYVDFVNGESLRFTGPDRISMMAALDQAVAASRGTVVYTGSPQVVYSYGEGC